MNEKSSEDAFPDDLSAAEIVADAFPTKPTRRRRTGSPKNIGVYDSDRDILDQYLFEVEQDTPVDPATGDGDCPVGPDRRCRCHAGADQAQSPLRHFRGQEVSEPGDGAQRSHRGGQPRPPHRGPEIRPRSGCQVHLLRGVVDSPVDPGGTGPARPHRPGAAQPHRRSLAHHPHLRDPAPGAQAGADPGRDRCQHRPGGRCSPLPRRAQQCRGASRFSGRAGRRALDDRSLHRGGAGGPRRAGDGAVPLGADRSGAPDPPRPRCQGAAALLRTRWRPGAHPRGDRRDAGSYSGAGAPAAGSRPQAAAGGSGGPGAGELRGMRGGSGEAGAVGNIASGQ